MLFAKFFYELFMKVAAAEGDRADIQTKLNDKGNDHAEVAVTDGQCG